MNCLQCVFLCIFQSIFGLPFSTLLNRESTKGDKGRTHGKLLWGGLIAFRYLSVSKRDIRAGEGFFFVRACSDRLREIALNRKRVDLG